VNERIRAREVRLLDEEGEQVGVVSREEAMRRAEQAELDLVMISPGSEGVPVCRLLDYSKYRYQEQKRKRESRQKQAQTRQDTKEIQFKIKIGEHDYDFKRRNAIRFLEHGDRVQAQIFFRGREQSHPEIGERILARLIEDVKAFGRPLPGQTMKREGRTITILIEPLASKKQVVAQAHPQSPPQSPPPATGAVSPAA
jgi:translation initiation factor IF-3